MCHIDTHASLGVNEIMLSTCCQLQSKSTTRLSNRQRGFDLIQTERYWQQSIYIPLCFEKKIFKYGNIVSALATVCAHYVRFRCERSLTCIELLTKKSEKKPPLRLTDTIFKEMGKARWERRENGRRIKGGKKKMNARKKGHQKFEIVLLVHYLPQRGKCF